MNFLGNAMNPNNGFNFANLFAPQPQRPNNPVTNNMTSSNTVFESQSPQQNLMPNPFNLINPNASNQSNHPNQFNQNLMPNPFNMTNPSNPTPLTVQNQPNPLNALQGMNLMSLFSGGSNNQP